jgi:4-hydroxy 2-oxovalerate aldolase
MNLNPVHILDCSLRDGGQLLETLFDSETGRSPRFGQENIKAIAQKLSDARLEIVELGVINTTSQNRRAVSVFPTVEELSRVMPKHRHDGQMFAGLIPDPDYPEKMIPKHTTDYCDIVRVILRYSDLEKSLDFCQMLSEKDYKVFLQPMVTMRYTDEDLRKVFDAANKMRAHAVYIVDSYGYMNTGHVNTLFEKFDANLDESIQIGLHLHNNMNLAFGTAIDFASRQTSRHLLLDSTILGMGQGAGNLQSELIIDYMNKHCGGRYDYNAILDACEIIEKLWGNPLWGYSVTHLLGAINNAAYKYAEDYRNKYKLSFAQIHQILSRMPDEYRHRYTPEFARELLAIHGFSGKLPQGKTE